MHAWLEFADALARAYNDWQIATWLEPEPRLRGSVHFVTFDPQLAVREIDRIGPHPQIVQAFLPVSSDQTWGDPIYQPIFDAAARHGLVVVMHHNGQTKTAVAHSRYWIEHHTLLGQAHMCQVVSLICSGVFERHPELRVAVLEGGFTWLPYLMWRFDQQHLEFRSEVPWLKRRPSDYIRDNFRFATQPMDRLETGHLLQLVDMMGSDRLLMYSSDYPHFDFDAPDRVLPPGVPDDLRERILWRNAADTYGFQLP
jgi:predicted TIM-barrel fold metal-dependent hydrolase